VERQGRPSAGRRHACRVRAGRPEKSRRPSGRPDQVSAFPTRPVAQGMKLLRMWVPDPLNPEFAAEAERQAKLLRGRPEEQEAIEFIMTVTKWPDT
jgi:hypothetical protein